jgi:ferrous iron transport protein B
MGENNKTILIVGNPNVGKSVIFSNITKMFATVSNYPGTTVEVTRGNCVVDKVAYTIYDTPGINNLIPSSEDEQVTRDIILKEEEARIILVGDAKNLERVLSLALQLKELRRDFILNLNMIDETEEKGIEINKSKLEEILNVPVITTCAIKNKDISGYFKEYKFDNNSQIPVKYDDQVEKLIQSISTYIKSEKKNRAFPILILSHDETIKEYFKNEDIITQKDLNEIESIIQDANKKINEPVIFNINKTRINHAREINNLVTSVKQKDKKNVKDFIGEAMMHPVWGILFLFASLYITYQVVGNFAAGICVDFFESTIFGEYVNPFFIKLFRYNTENPDSNNMIVRLIVGEYGIITMALTYAFAIILPIVTFFFIIFGIFEDSGYLPRLAIMVNKLFKVMGLNGKAVLPMVLGLGCDTMATITTRILETKKERIIATLLLALGIPCTAQLGVFLGMAAALQTSGVLIWCGIIFAVMLLVGFLASKIIKGKGSDFILEIPPIRVPTIANLSQKTLARLEWYLKEAVPLFVLGTFILFVLHETHLINIIITVLEPIVVDFLGLPREASEAFIIGFFRRDYAATGLFMLSRENILTPTQVLVGLVTITLFVPCIANFFIIVKERGLKTAVAMVCFIFPFAFFVGGILNKVLRAFGG